MKRVLYIVAGCNGSGKTTASKTLFPKYLNIEQFINADEIAMELAPTAPGKVALPAGKLMLSRIQSLLVAGISFAIETTFAGKVYQRIICHARSLNYQVVTVFFWLSTQQLAIERVKFRVARGGHHIPEAIVRRRYQR